MLKSLLLLALLSAYTYTADIGCTSVLVKPGPTSVAAVTNKCARGYHFVNGQCVPNSKDCASFDCVTMNCASCSWSTFQIDSAEVTVDGDRTGNYCVSRWWAWTLMAFALLVLLMLLIGIVMYFCRRKGATKEKIPLINKKPVHVGTSKPKAAHPVEHHNHERIERGEPITRTSQPVIVERREDGYVGERVHVETRTYSPQREMQRDRVNEPNWATYSQAHWNEHDN